MPSSKAQIKVPPRSEFLDPVLAFILAYAGRYALPAGEGERLKSAVQAALALVFESYAAGNTEEPVSVSVLEAESRLVVEVLNRGVPIPTLRIPTLREATKGVEKFALENLGRRGQLIRLEVKPGQGALGKCRPSDRIRGEPVAPAEEDIALRPLAAGEETALSQLFYFVYGYDYIHEFIYYPDKIRSMLESGKLFSTVAALPDGRLLGHVGLVKWGDSPPVYEAALGVVDPMVKSRGLFRRLFEETLERIKRTPMQYCFFDFVTNHDLSQKLISKYGTCDMALLVGSQSAETQARLDKLGLGSDPEGMDRYTILLAIIPRVPHPFGQEIALPSSLGEPLEFLLQPLGLSWSPAPRFEVLPQEGSFKALYQPLQKSVVFDLFKPGRKAVADLIEEWRQALKDGYQYAAVDAPLSEPGLGNLYALLSADGFFVAGFVPYRFSDRLAFRFQAVGPAEVAFAKIKVASNNARNLLEIVKRDYERTHI